MLRRKQSHPSNEKCVANRDICFTVLSSLCKSTVKDDVQQQESEWSRGDQANRQTSVKLY
jgi:hypothetical protein